MTEAFKRCLIGPDSKRNAQVILNWLRSYDTQSTWPSCVHEMYKFVFKIWSDRKRFKIIKLVKQRIYDGLKDKLPASDNKFGGDR